MFLRKPGGAYTGYSGATDLAGAFCIGGLPGGTYDLEVRVDSHRKDVLPLPAFAREGAALGYRVNGKVLPVDERYVGHWNHDPWRLDSAGDERTLGDGAGTPRRGRPNRRCRSS